MTKLNNYHLNGKHITSKKDNQITALKLPVTDKLKTRKLQGISKNHKFEQSVVLRQSPVWSRAIMASMIGLACFGTTWAYFAKIEQVIPAVGQLKPEGAVKEIQAPIGGIIKDVHVKDGQKVKSGDLLLNFDTTATNAELNSLQKIRTALIQENQIYRKLNQLPSSELSYPQNLPLPKESSSLLKTRSALLAENELLRKELGKTGNSNILGLDEQERLNTARTELDTRATAAQLEVKQINAKLAQNQVQISDAKVNLALEGQIANKLKMLSEEGGISQLQYLQQQKKVQNISAQIAQLLEEQQRLKFDIQQGQIELKNSIANSHKNILEKITANKTKIAEIESQFTKILLDNEKRLAEINSKFSQVQLSAKYQQIKAPVNGTIFDLQASPNFVTRQSEKLLSIVPNDNFVAEAFITNKDIGFVREGMKVDVRIDSFPFSEFGDIKGKVTWVGSDALPPDENYRYYRFPIKIKLNNQFLNVKGKNISLQSGMSITANVKVREERRVISLFTELFTKQLESLEEVR